LTRIPGIGKKTAERIVVELRDSFAKGLDERERAAAGGRLGVRDEALMALQALGYSRAVAEKAVTGTALSLSEGSTESASELIKAALRKLTIPDKSLLYMTVEKIFCLNSCLRDWLIYIYNAFTVSKSQLESLSSA